MARNSETQALIDRIEASRRHLGHEVASLREKLDIPKQLKLRIARKPWLWFGGSAAAGLLVTLLLRRPRRKKRAQLPLPRLLMAALPALLKPMIKSFLTREIQRRVLGNPAGSNQPDGFSLSKP